jgi:hypothetical protein
MAKTIILTDRDNGNHFMWNTHANVGPNCPNRADDVQLVQLGYICLGTGTTYPGDDQGLADLAAKINPGDPYTGSPSDPLSLAIRRHQMVHVPTSTAT